MAKSTKISGKSVLTICGVCAVLLLVVGIVNAFDGTEPVQQYNPPQQETTAQETEPAQDLSCIDIIRIADHPTLFGKTEDAKNIFGAYLEKGAVVIRSGIDHNLKHDDAFLILDCYENNGSFVDSEQINGIYIYPDVSISLGEALEIVNEYLPVEIINEWYEPFETCYQNISDNRIKYYAVYKISEEGNSKIKSKELPYSIWLSFSVTVDPSGDVVSIILFDNRTGNSRFESEKFDWDYNIPAN